MTSRPSKIRFLSHRLMWTARRLILSVDNERPIVLRRQQILEDAGYEVLSVAKGRTGAAL